MAGAIALTQEARAASASSFSSVSSQLIFLDRSALDNLGYARARGYEAPDFLTPDVTKQLVARIRRVFVLDPVGSNREALAARNQQSGRADDPGGAQQLSELMFKVYSEQGCTTTRLADGTVEERCARLLAECGVASSPGSAPSQHGPFAAVLPPHTTLDTFRSVSADCPVWGST